MTIEEAKQLMADFEDRWTDKFPEVAEAVEARFMLSASVGVLTRCGCSREFITQYVTDVLTVMEQITSSVIDDDLKTIIGDPPPNYKEPLKS